VTSRFKHKQQQRSISSPQTEPPITPTTQRPATTPDAQLNNTAYFMYAHPDENGVPIGDYVHHYETKEELQEAIRTGVYREWSRDGGCCCGLALY